MLELRDPHESIDLPTSWLMGRRTIYQTRSTRASSAVPRTRPSSPACRRAWSPRPTSGSGSRCSSPTTATPCRPGCTGKKGRMGVVRSHSKGKHKTNSSRLTCSPKSNRQTRRQIPGNTGSGVGPRVPRRPSGQLVQDGGSRRPPTASYLERRGHRRGGAPPPTEPRALIWTEKPWIVLFSH